MFEVSYHSIVKLFRKLIYSKLVNVALGVLLAAIWGTFAWSHVVAFDQSKNIAFVAFCISESLQAVMFVVRRMPEKVSEDLFAWTVGAAGTFVPLLLRPGGSTLWAQGDMVLLLGVFVQIIGLLFLNRSFAIVPALRSVKTGGLYGLVRHPIYASYILLFGGYVLFNASPINAAVVILAFIFMYLRIQEEEQLLFQDPSYAAYAKRVKWRLIPFVY